MKYETAFWALLILGYVSWLHDRYISTAVVYLIAAAVFFFPQYI